MFLNSSQSPFTFPTLWGTIILPSHQERRETTSTEEFRVTCLKWLDMHRAAQIPVGDDMGFCDLTLRSFVPESWL